MVEVVFKIFNLSSKFLCIVNLFVELISDLFILFIELFESLFLFFVCVFESVDSVLFILKQRFGLLKLGVDFIKVIIEVLVLVIKLIEGLLEISTKLLFSLQFLFKPVIGIAEAVNSIFKLRDVT